MSDEGSLGSRTQVKGIAYEGGWSLRGVDRNRRSTALAVVSGVGSESSYEIESTQIERDTRPALRFVIKINEVSEEVIEKIMLIDNNPKMWGKYPGIK